jgi:hypothetical protein
MFTVTIIHVYHHPHYLSFSQTSDSFSNKHVYILSIVYTSRGAGSQDPIIVDPAASTSLSQLTVLLVIFPSRRQLLYKQNRISLF